MYFTFTEDAHETEHNEHRRRALEKVAEWAGQVPDNCTVVFRSSDDGALSVWVDLLDPLYDDV